jgi:hypothetical protein
MTKKQIAEQIKKDAAEYNEKVTQKLLKSLSKQWYIFKNDLEGFIIQVEKLVADVAFIHADWNNKEVQNYLHHIKCYQDTINGRCGRIKDTVNQIMYQQQYM